METRYETHEYVDGKRVVIARTDDRHVALRAALDALARGFAAQNTKEVEHARSE